MNYYLENATILDPKGEFKMAYIHIKEGIVKVISPVPLTLPKNIKILNLHGKLVLPGFIDMHVHLREPGYEYKETVATGTLAGARGGFTTVACMPNTRPFADKPEIINYIKEKAANEGHIRVLPIGAITENEAGLVLTDFKALKECGVLAYSDDGNGVQDEAMMELALKTAKELNMPVLAHCEDDHLANGGAMHDGEFAKKHKIKGLCSESEVAHVRRDIRLSEKTGCHYHVCHISAKESLQLVREAKLKGLKVTCEVTPHHILLCDEEIPEVDANFKMNPPLRSNSDRKAIVEALRDGTIDIIATDHAPHTGEEKAREIHCAPFGVVGLETAFPLLYTHLVIPGTLTLKQLVDLMTIKPARLFNLPYGRLAMGLEADLTVIDLDKEKIVDPNKFLSKGKNTPFKNWRLKGFPLLTMYQGKIAWKDESVWN